jgi:hypothetical protein
MIETTTKEELINGIRVVKTYANIASLKADPQNPRDISEDKLEDLINFLTKYPALKPLLVDARPDKEGQLIGGNQRLKAYKILGTQEIWIEPRIPSSDAEAFEMAIIDNQQFGQYMEINLKTLAKQFESELDLAKLEVDLKPESLEYLIMPQSQKKMKYEIIIRCIDENDLNQKMLKLSEVGLSGKKRGK